MRKVILVFLMAAFVLSCSKRSPINFEGGNKSSLHKDVSAELEMVSEPPPPSAVDITKNKPVKEETTNQTRAKKIIKDGNMSIQVSNVSKARASIGSILKKCNGYIASESLSNETWNTSITFKIRVPAQNFDVMITDIENGGGKILSKSINARDVTSEFIDTEIRLANKRKVNERYTELLKKANTVKDILEIEENIRKLEEEIESTEGKLKYLNDQVDFSTLDLTITQERTTGTYSPGFMNKLWESVRSGWEGLIGFIIIFINLWPIWLLGIGFWFLIKRIRKNRKLKKTIQNQV